ncbi:MAG: kelch repeat-containing protein [Bacteroidia bacterium]
MMKYYLLLLSAMIFASPIFAQWNSANSMSVSRAGHISEALNDGGILVAGGWDFNSNLLSAEVYNPETDSWTSTPDMESEHYNGASVKLDDGKVLVIAGFTGSFNTETCELYDPVQNNWSEAGFLSQGRASFTATKLNDGKVLVVGGFDGTNNLNSCELYDPQTNSWSLVASLATARSYHTANILLDGKLLIAGGFNPNAGFQLSSVEIYDPVADLWSAGSPMIIARDYHASVILNDGRIMVSGGRYFNGSVNFAYNGLIDVEIYNPTTFQWDFDEPLPQGLSYHKMVTLQNGDVLAVAGVDSSNTSSSGAFTTYASNTFLYDILNGEWTEASLQQESRYEFGVSRMSNGKVIVSGGLDASVEVYDVVTSLSTVSQNESFYVSPNPAANFVVLSGTKNIHPSSIQMIDLSGKIHSVQSETLASNKLRISINGLSSGCYILSFKDVLGNIHHSKVIVSASK